jgi:hypothetical protein
MFGREIERLASMAYDAGTHHVDWEASHLPTGIYFARLLVSGIAANNVHVATKKMILSK